MNVGPTPQVEAAQIFNRILSELTSADRDIMLLLRLGSHACTLLGWQQLQWVQHERQGYPTGVELPWYRKTLYATLEWRGHAQASSTASILDSTFPQPIPTTAEIREGIHLVVGWAATGTSAPTGKAQLWKSMFGVVELKEHTFYPSSTFQSIVARVEETLFSFASNSYTTLQYGDAMESLWQSHRRIVEQQLTDLGLTQHLDAINRGLASANPQEWRQVMWSCRDSFHDLARYLWQDRRPVYNHLEGSGKGGKLPVTQSHYVNRLGAYLHQKSGSSKLGKYLRAEMERIYGSINALNELDSTAHAGVSREDARSAALATYFILGEFIQRTDMQPITEYSAASPSSGDGR